MFDWLNYLGTEDREIFIPETEEEIIIREALAMRENNSPMYQAALLALGQRLSTWGEELQNRYDNNRTFEFKHELTREPC